MQATRKWFLAAGMVLALTASAWAEKAPDSNAGTGGAEKQPAKVVKIGDKVDDFTFKDIRYLPRTLADFGSKKAYVLVFSTLDCPVVARYLPKLAEMEAGYRDQGVQFVSINVAPNDDLREIAFQAVKANAEFPFAKDFVGEAPRAVGATRAGQVVVLDADKKLRYRGRIDDQFRLGGERPTASRDDLKLAIDDVLAGRDVATAETAVDGCLITYPKPQPRATLVTFAEHVSSLLQKHCQDCHRPEHPEAPFSLASYQDAVDHADMIAEVVNEQRMPPWYATAEHGHGKFENERRMTADERSLIADWVRGECLPGDMSKAPSPRVFSKAKWKIGEPDLVLKTPVQKIPPSGYIDYRYVILPYSFKEDTWVQGVQILPKNSRAMHHCNMLWMQLGSRPSNENFITGQVPGGDPMILDKNVGFKMPAGSSLVLQIHYVTIGEETTDQIEVGLKFAKETIHKTLQHYQVTNLKFKVPPGAPHYPVAGSRVLKADMTGYGMFSHMHLRGKDMTFRALHPDGTDETLLVVPNYSFDWQQAYRWSENQVKFPKGTKLEVSAHFDNSAFNPYNPDASKIVDQGQQTFQEMMYGFVFFTQDDEHLNLTIDPKSGHVVKPGSNESAAK